MPSGEHFALDAARGEDRQIDDHDDEDTEQLGRPLPAPLADSPRIVPARERALDALFLAQAAGCSSPHDDRAVHDEAEVERTETHQIAADLAPTMPVMVNSMESGIASAMMSAARMFPAGGTGSRSPAPRLPTDSSSPFRASR